MTETYFDEHISSMQASLAFGKVYPPSSVIPSGIVSALGAVMLGLGGALQLGYIDSLGGPGLLARLGALTTFAVIVTGTAFSASLSAYVFFGLMAPDDATAVNPQLSNPFSYFVSALLLSAVGIVAFLLATSLGDLSPLLGLVVAGGLCLGRYRAMTYTVAIADSVRLKKLLALLTLLVPVVAVVGGYALGAFPNWTYEQWTVALLYVAVAITAVSAPADMVNNRLDSSLSAFVDGLARRAAAERRAAQLTAQAPDGCPVELPALPAVDSISDTAGSMDRLDRVESWLEAYREYLNRYEHLDGLVDGGIRHQAATGDRSNLDTVVSTFAEQLHPRHYDDPDRAVEAAQVIGSIINAYDHGYVTEPADLTDRPYLDEYLDISGPQPHQLSDIEALFESD